MAFRALITGGAGFIGSHLADRLLGEGYRVRVLDSLVPQVHGLADSVPRHLSERAELRLGDVRDARVVASALEDVDCVFHFAALVGVGQSMYQAAHYVDVNVHGTAVLLEQLARRRVERLVVASSMSVYGEGACVQSDGQPYHPQARGFEQLKRGEWAPTDASGRALAPIATAEDKPPALESVYALTKYDQERLCLMMGRAYGIPTVALRFFNVYGARQALSNPYTGVLAIFSSRLLNDSPPLLFEDGLQQRDFVSVHDVVSACLLALEREQGAGLVFNVGSGQPRSVLQVAKDIARALNKAIEPEVSNRYRVGDIRHCFADIGLARQVLGYQPRVAFEDGIAELADFLRAQSRAGHVTADRALDARRELEERGLTL